MLTKITKDNGASMRKNPSAAYGRLADMPVICPYDPAIWKEESDMEKYIETRDIELLTFHPDMEPTIFWIRGLPTRITILIQQESTHNPAAWVRYFHNGLVRAENLLGTDGVLYPVYIPNQDNPGMDWKIVGKDIDLFAIEDVLEIATMVETRSFLHPKRKPKYALLDTSRRLMNS